MQTCWKGVIHSQQIPPLFSSYLLYWGNNLVLQYCWPVSDVHRAWRRCFEIQGRPPKPQLNLSVIIFDWAPDAEGRLGYTGWFDGLSSQKHTCPSFSLLRGSIGTVGQFVIKMLKAGTRQGKFWWNGEREEVREVRHGCRYGASQKLTESLRELLLK